jgi:hypothetical protein
MTRVHARHSTLMTHEIERATSANDAQPARDYEYITHEQREDIT